MSDNFIMAQETIHGQEGSLQINYNGNIKTVAEIKECETSISMNKTEMRIMGSPFTQHKEGALSGTGTMTIYAYDDFFIDLIISAIKTRKFPRFTAIVEMKDSSSTAGTRKVAYYECSLDESVISRITVEDGAMEFEVPFTFSDMEKLNGFTERTI